MQKLFEKFHRSFELISVDTPELLDLAYALRYQVYCIENPYEDRAEHRNGKETDRYDPHSVHTLVAHRDSGICAGVLRLILSNPQDPDNAFPMEAQCKALTGHRFFAARGFPRHSTAELSRFAISKCFRQRIVQAREARTCRNGNAVQDIVDRAAARETTQHIILGMFAAAVRMSVECGVTHWYAVMEPTLLRLLARFGIHFQQVGPLVDYHGKRQPAFAVIEDLMAGVYRRRRDVWEIMSDCGYVWPAPNKTHSGGTELSLTHRPEPAFV